MMQYLSSKELVFRNRRFDLIYKILYLEHINSSKETFDYYKKMYLKSIEVFNGFHEKNPPKNSSEDFINAFNATYNNISRNGFNPAYAIPISRENQLYDGAHRLSIAYLLDIDVPVRIIESDSLSTKRSVPIEYAFNYQFFKRRGMSEELADIGALEYVKRNEKAHIVQLSPIASCRYDSKVEEILNKYGFVYYKKELRLNYNALVRIKQINYGEEDWAGNSANGYKGLRKHAQKSIGYGKTRVFVFVCDSLDEARNAKNEVRGLFNYGNHPIHINDTHKEAVALANIFFNRNAVDLVQSTSYLYYERIVALSNLLKEYGGKYRIDLDSICVSSSSILSIYGLRDAADVDCISFNNTIVKYKDISSHSSEKEYYPFSFERIINEHLHHFVFNNVKFASLRIVKDLKKSRREYPKDFKDLLLCVKKDVHKTKYYLSTILFYAPKSHIIKLLNKTN